MNSSKKIKFAMAFHGFQPVFNFEKEVEKAFASSYKPFLETMADFPGIKGSFHFSGNMLEWFEKKHPEYIDLLKMMEKRGQIEIMGGGFFEPVMALIPRRDSLQQIDMMNAAVERIFGSPPAGAWTTERVWSADLMDIFSRKGIRYTILDDHHILSAGIRSGGIFKTFRVKNGNSSLILFPALTRLRYTMPFRPPRETVEYIRNAAGSGYGEENCFFFADDLEKFGTWPRTYGHVYTRGWLRKFFSLLLSNRNWLETLTYSDIMASSEPGEIEQMPETSYSEMDSWSGGHFLNFLTKYPESGRMHRRMLSVSAMIERARSVTGSEDNSELLDKAEKELFKAQTGCPYWHGTFGGVYLPNLRSAVYRHLIGAESLVESAIKDEDERIIVIQDDSDKGMGEVVMCNKFLKLYTRPRCGAVVEEIDLKKNRTNLINSFSRRRETYHRKLEKGYSAVIKKARRQALKGNFSDIHEVLGVRQKGLKRFLSYDLHKRGCFLTRVITGRYPWSCLERSEGSCHPGFLDGAYISDTEGDKDGVVQKFSRTDTVFSGKGESMDLEIVKSISLEASDPSVVFSQKISKLSGGFSGLRWAAEFNFLIWDTLAMKGPRVSKMDGLVLKDKYSGVKIKLSFPGNFTALRYPVYTVNESESGLGKTFQGICVVVGDQGLFGKGREIEEMKITMDVE